MLHFGKIPKKIGQNLAKFSKILTKFADFWNYANASIPQELLKIEFPFLFNSHLRNCNHVQIIANTKRPNAKRVFFDDICISYILQDRSHQFSSTLRICNHVKIISNTKRPNAKRVFFNDICISYILQDRSHQFSSTLKIL